VKDRLDAIGSVRLWTHHSARHLNKTGPLHNFADRDHCIQYIAAIGLIFGRLTAQDYEDAVAADPRIDRLRAKMTVTIDGGYTRGLHDPKRRSNPHAIQVRFKDGTCTDKVEIEYPLGHPRRRAEGLPLLVEKFKTNLARAFPPKRQQAILDACADQRRLEKMPVNEFVEMFVV
jgi:2-methylcitrate dehydratase